MVKNQKLLRTFLNDTIIAYTQLPTHPLLYTNEYKRGMWI